MKKSQSNRRIVTDPQQAINATVAVLKNEYPLGTVTERDKRGVVFEVPEGSSRGPLRATANAEGKILKIVLTCDKPTTKKTSLCINNLSLCIDKALVDAEVIDDQGVKAALAALSPIERAHGRIAVGQILELVELDEKVDLVTICRNGENCNVVFVCTNRRLITKTEGIKYPSAPDLCQLTIKKEDEGDKSVVLFDLQGCEIKISGLDPNRAEQIRCSIQNLKDRTAQAPDSQPRVQPNSI
ncbi:hypothetical protein [Corynebacterium pygosceleis]|uniref:hypothetical protein n=1 Tax=Corynebacterium pygosceleis TaxID=2800406 RepID=UPI001903DAEB|nr:hypothetical protein [Corynebacterium pygosceleis]MCL0120664.1 hypothetical protein [Corynebacterium pygosceleis]